MASISNFNSILEKYNFNPETNPMGAYDNTTYHITFSLLSDMSDAKVIIAESGATIMNIQALSFTQTVGPCETSKNIGTNTIRMSIFDPFSADLYDKLKLAADTLQLYDPNNGVFLIEITYGGYDPKTGSPVRTIYGKTKFKCIITAIHTQITVAGSRNDLELIEVTDIGSLDDFMVIDQSIPVQPKSNSLGDILTDFATKLNEAKRQNYANTDIVTYVFKDEPYPSQYVKDGCARPFDLITTIDDSLLKQPQRNNGEVNAPKSSTIQNIIEQLLSNSGTAVNLLGNRSTDGKTFDAESYYGIGHKILISVQYGNWSSLYKKYRKIITYKIVPYKCYNVMNSPENIQQHDTDELTSKKFRDLCNSNCLKKQYNYQYTGTNTEVLNFDIKTNMYYNLLFTPSMGAASYSNATSKAGTPDPRSLLNGLYNDQSKLLDDQNNLTAQLASNPTNAQAIQSQININNGKLASLKQKIFDLGNATNISDSANAEIKRNSLSAIGSSYVDDLDKTVTSNKYNIINPSSILTNNVTPLGNSGMVEAFKDSGQSIYSALLSQYYGSTTDALQMVTIDIKLDPFWIAQKTGTNEVNSNPTVEDYGSHNMFSDGFQHFLLKYNIPSGVDSNGAPILKMSDIYSGIYQVITVETKFNEGGMSQTLQASKLMSLTLGRLLSGIVSNNPIGGSASVLPSTGAVANSTSSLGGINLSNISEMAKQQSANVLQKLNSSEKKLSIKDAIAGVTRKV